MLEVLRAAKALPFFYGQSVFIDGANYIDSGLQVSLTDLVNKAISLRATHIIVIDVQVKTPAFLFVKKVLRAIVLGRKKTGTSYHLEKNAAQVFILSPVRNPAGLLTRDSKKLAASFDFGYDDTKNNRPLNEFLSSFR